MCFGQSLQEIFIYIYFLNCQTIFNKYQLSEKSLNQEMRVCECVGGNVDGCITKMKKAKCLFSGGCREDK